MRSGSCAEVHETVWHPLAAAACQYARRMTCPSSVRDRTSSLRKTLRRWYSIVFGLRNSASATSPVGASLAHGEPDLELLRRELLDGGRLARAGVLAGRGELAPRAVRPGQRARPLERLERRAEVSARGRSPAGPPQRLAEAQLGPRALERPRRRVVESQRGLEVLGAAIGGQQAAVARRRRLGPRCGPPRRRRRANASSVAAASSTRSVRMCASTRSGIHSRTLGSTTSLRACARATSSRCAAASPARPSDSSSSPRAAFARATKRDVHDRPGARERVRRVRPRVGGASEQRLRRPRVRSGWP